MYNKGILLFLLSYICMTYICMTYIYMYDNKNNKIPFSIFILIFSSLNFLP